MIQNYPDHISQSCKRGKKKTNKKCYGKNLEKIRELFKFNSAFDLTSSKRRIIRV